MKAIDILDKLLNSNAISAYEYQILLTAMNANIDNAKSTKTKFISECSNSSFASECSNTSFSSNCSNDKFTIDYSNTVIVK